MLKLLLERLRNEITRLPAVKAFAILAHSHLELGLESSLDATMVSCQHLSLNQAGLLVAAGYQTAGTAAINLVTVVWRGASCADCGLIGTLHVDVVWPTHLADFYQLL